MTSSVGYQYDTRAGKGVGNVYSPTPNFSFQSQSQVLRPPTVQRV
jgi:hypothetical protein